MSIHQWKVHNQIIEQLANGLVNFAPSVGMYASFAGDLLILNCWQEPHPDMQFCYIEFLPEHSPMFSSVLCSHMTPFHPFRPNLLFQNINTLWSLLPFCRIPASAPHLSYQLWTNYAQAITEPFWNLSGGHGTPSEASQIHSGTFTISIMCQH